MSARTITPVKENSSTGASELIIRDVQVFNGPGKWSPFPVVCALVDTGDIDRRDPVLLERIDDGLSRMLHRFAQLTPDAENNPAADRWLTSAASDSLDKTCERAAFEIVRLAGWEVSDVGCADAGESRFFLYLDFVDSLIATRAIAFAVQVVNSVIAGESENADLAQIFESLQLIPGEMDSLERYVFQAHQRGIPVRRFDGDDRTIELGTGAHITRTRGQMSATCTVIGVQNAGDKSLTNMLLGDRGLPVPKNVEVGTAKQAVAAAKQIGFPVVLKPISGNHGRGVCINLRTPEEVETMFPIAARESRHLGVVVESFLEGRDFRILVIDDKIAGVTERVPAAVTGDGRHDIRELIEIENRDPNRGKPFENVLNLITIDDIVIDTLRRQNLTLADVPAEGQVVFVRQTGNISTGGTSIDRTDEIHPDNAMVARIAAKTIGLRMAGIDIIMPDISKSIWETGGGIAEVNSGPGFRLHSRPFSGPPRNVVGAVIDMYYPPGAPVRVPVIAITESQISESVATLVAKIASESEHAVGLALPDRAEINGVVIPAARSDHAPARMVLRNLTTQLAVIASADRDLEHPGLEFRIADVVVLTGRRPLPARKNDPQIEDRLLTSLAPQGFVVLFADDPRAPSLVEHQDGAIVLVGTASHPLIEQHRSAGGRTITLQEDTRGITLVGTDGGEPQVYGVLDSATEHAETVGLVVGAALAHGFDSEHIRRAVGLVNEVRD